MMNGRVASERSSLEKLKRHWRWRNGTRSWVLPTDTARVGCFSSVSRSPLFIS